MVLANEEPSDDALAHPFWYACVLGVYHVMVLYGQVFPRKKIWMEFL